MKLTTHQEVCLRGLWEHLEALEEAIRDVQAPEGKSYRLSTGLPRSGEMSLSAIFFALDAARWGVIAAKTCVEGLARSYGLWLRDEPAPGRDHATSGTVVTGPDL